MTRIWLQLASMASVCLAGSALLTSQAPQAPPAAQAPAPPPAQGGRGGIEAQIAMGADFLPRPPVVRQDPGVQQRLMLVPDGYTIEPILHDPLIQGPVGVTFDGNGRMYVIEMRSYMRDAEGTGSREPISRISRHEDTDGDGTYDRSTVFLDNLVLPRMAFPLADGEILVLETDNRDMFKYTDTDGDGVADRKDLFYENVGRVTNMEWQPGGLTWALDNWLYMTYNPFRLRIAPDGRILREETEPNGGQWWSAQDNYGKTWWVDGGGEIGPVNFQAPIAYGAFNVADNFEPDFQVPWPAPGGIADMQGGMNRVRMPEGTLNHFTSASGVEIYRGHRLPPDMIGDLLFGEPVGRIVRRAKVVVTEGLTQLQNAYPKSEFIRSTDPLFRPVAVHNAPDGTIVVVDMYTGIIQDAQFVGPNSYLRRKIDQYQLDRLHSMGRLWRVSHGSMAPDRRQPRMYQDTPAELVKHLEHPNGWWRDTAQKLLVLRRDKSVVPALVAMARRGGDQLGRIHALWTLEGLEALDARLARELMKSPDPQIRIQALRASESLYKAGDKSFAADYRALAEDGDANVVIQAMLTLNLQRVPDARQVIAATAAAHPARGVKEIGGQILRPAMTFQGQRPSLADSAVNVFNMSPEQRRGMQRGEAVYREVCTACHAPDGSGAPMMGAPAGTKLAPPLGGAVRVTGHRDYVIKVLLHGLTGPLGDQEYPGGVMVPMGSNTDEWIADVSNYVRNSFGNSALFVTPEQVAAVRKGSGRTGLWTLPELEASLPRLLASQAQWKLTASHNGDAAANAAGTMPGARWDTGGAAQQAGMWFQIELPQPASVTEVQIESAAPPAGRGGRGRGAAPAGRGAAGGAPGPTPAAPQGAATAPAAASTGAAATPPAGPAAAPATAGTPAAPIAAPASGGAAGTPPAGTLAGSAAPGTPAAAQAPPAGRGGGRGGPPAAGPAAYSVQVSLDGAAWSPPIAEGVGATPVTVIHFRPVQARFIRINQTGTALRNEQWAIGQIRVYEAGASAAP